MKNLRKQKLRVYLLNEKKLFDFKEFSCVESLMAFAYKHTNTFIATVEVS